MEKKKEHTNVKFRFEDLKIYQKALDFVDEVYAVTKRFPKEERYQLTSQFQRSAVSIALNIAEGRGDSNPQFNRFLQIAKGSINECVVCSSIALRQGYIDKEKEYVLRKQLEELAKMLSGLTTYLKST